MLRARSYAQRRLGGRSEVLVENFGHPEKSEVPKARARVAEVAAALEKAGFPAGAPATRRLFHLP
jgi:hypothetical protein